MVTTNLICREFNSLLPANIGKIKLEVENLNWEIEKKINDPTTYYVKDANEEIFVTRSIVQVKLFYFFIDITFFF